MRNVDIRGDEGDFHRIFAVMVFPDDELFCDSYLQMLIDQKVLAEDRARNSQPWWERPRWAEMKSKASDSVRRGIVAGEFLVVYEALARLGFNEPSGRKTAQALEKYLKGRTYGDGENIKASARKIPGDFDFHRDTAHLWAAHIVFLTRYGKDNARAHMETLQGTHEYLRIAGHYQHYGLQARTPRTNVRHGLLDAASVWRVPQGIEPAPASTLPDFAPEIARYIDEYSHE